MNRRVRLTAGLGGMNTLDWRNGATTCVPECKDLDGIRHDAVVEMIIDAAEVNAPDARESCVARERTNLRLTPDQRKGSLDLVAPGAAVRLISHHTVASSISAVARRATRIASN